MPLRGDSFTSTTTTTTDLENDRIRLDVAFVFVETIQELPQYSDQVETKVDDGLSFENINSNGVIIHQFGKVPLRRSGRQFRAFQGTIEASDTPTILYATSFQEIFSVSGISDVPSIQLWDTGEVISLYQAFWKATNFNANISTWDTSRVTTLEYAFKEAKNFNQNISTKEVTMGNNTYIAWKTGKVQSLRDTFYNADVFNNNGESFHWNTYSVRTFENTFYNAYQFNQDISTKLVSIGTYSFVAWNTYQSTNMKAMFYNAQAYNESMANWDVSHVIDFENFLRGATAFNQYLGNWSVLPGIQMNNMFKNTQLSQEYTFLPITPVNVEYTFYLSNTSNGWIKYMNGEPTDVQLDNVSINENVAIGTEIGQLSTLGTNSDTLEYFIEDNEYFEIINNEKVVTKKELDYETVNSVVVNILVRDTDTNESAVTPFMFNVVNVSEGPIDISITTTTASGETSILINEQTVPSGTPISIGTIIVNWGEEAPSLFNPIEVVNNSSGADGENFTVVESNGAYTLALIPGSVFDYATKSVYVLDIRATTSSNSTYSKDITVNINDVPVFSEIADANINNGSPIEEITFTVTDSNTIDTLQVTGLPSWLQFSPSSDKSSGTFNGTPSLSIGDTAVSTITITATDDTLGTSTTSFTISVRFAPQISIVTIPVATKGKPFETSEIIITEGTSPYTIVLSDATLSSYGSWLSITNNKVTGTPPADIGDSTITFEVKVTDSTDPAFISTQSFQLELEENVKPVISNVSDTTIQIDQDMTALTVTVVDEDDTTLTLSAKLTDNSALPTWLEFVTESDGKTGTFSGKPPLTSPNTLSIEIEAVDSAGESVIHQFVLTINRPPVFQNTPSSTGRTGKLYEHTINVTDEEGENITLELLGTIPTGMTLTNNKIQWTPSTANTYSGIKIRATDQSQGIQEQTFEIIVQQNVPPSISSITDKYFIKDQQDVVVTVLVTEIDSDDTITTVVEALDQTDQVINIPEWIQVTISTNNKSVTINGSNTVIQSVRLRITSTDESGESDSVIFNIYITASPPTLPAFSNMDVYLANEISAVTYTISSDSAASVLSVSATNKPAWLNIVYNNDYTFTISGTPNDNLGEDISVTIKVSDANGNTSTEQSFTISVKQYVVGNTSIQMDTSTIQKFDDMPEEKGKEIVKDFIANSIGESAENIEIISFTVNTGSVPILRESMVVRIVNNTSSSPSLNVVYKVETTKTDSTIEEELESNGNSDQLVTSFNTVAETDETIVPISTYEATQLDQAFETNTTTVTDTSNADATGKPTIKTLQGELVTNNDDVIVGKTLYVDVSGVADADGINNDTKAYIWIRRDSEDNDTDTTVSTTSYTLTEDDIGFKIGVRYMFDDIYGYSSSINSDFTQYIVLQKYDIVPSSIDQTLIGIGQDATITFVSERSIAEFNQNKTGYISINYDGSVVISDGSPETSIAPMGLWIGPDNGNPATSIYYSSKIDDSTKTVTLKEGWNMIGVSQDSVIQDDDNIIDAIYRYVDKKYQLVNLSHLQEHQGRLVYCNQDGNIKILSLNSSSGT